MLQYENILVPIDFAEISNSAIAQAAKHSEASNSQLTVVHVIDNSDCEAATAEEQTQLIRQKEREIDQLLDQLEIGYCEKVVVCGKTVPSILNVIASHKSDLVVMGTHRGRNPSDLAHSITREVVANTECDVLVLHK
jgi:nucleotide-binding universal stress UspA family protein